MATNRKSQGRDELRDARFAEITTLARIACRLSQEKDMLDDTDKSVVNDLHDRLTRQFEVDFEGSR